MISDFIYISIIIIIGFIISSRTERETGRGLTYLLFLYHFSFSYIYFWYAQSHSADANMYFAKAKISYDVFATWGLGTDSIIFTSSFFVQYLGFSKLSLFFLFGLFGFIGSIYLIRMLNNKPIYFFGIHYVTIILFLPGFHFWTAALGKDSLFFMLLMMFFYYLSKIDVKNIIKLLLAWTLLTIIRPHMGFIIGFAILIAIFLKNPVKYRAQHFLIAGLSIIFIIVFFPYLAEFLNVDAMKLEDFNNRLESFSQYGANQADGLNSYVDVTNYPLPLKMFAYLFRPLFFDVHSIMQLIASFENLLLLLLILKWLKLIKYKLLRWYKYQKLPYQIMFVYVLISWVILSAGMYNLGLASRQKFMILPVIFILFFRLPKIRSKQ